MGPDKVGTDRDVVLDGNLIIEVPFHNHVERDERAPEKPPF